MSTEYLVEEKPKCTGKRTRPGTPSSPDLGGSVRLFDEDGNQLETDGKTGEIKGTVLQFYSFTVFKLETDRKTGELKATPALQVYSLTV